jgi:hypothetical protein
MIEVLRFGPRDEADMRAEYIAAPVMFPKPDLASNMTLNHLVPSASMSCYLWQRRTYHCHAQHNKNDFIL